MRLFRALILKAKQANCLQPVLHTLKYNMHAISEFLDTLLFVALQPKLSEKVYNMTTPLVVGKA